MPFGPLGTQQPTSLILWLLAFLAMATLSQNAKKEDYYDLTDYLFDGYKKEVRPVLDDDNVIQIYVTFSLFQIVDVSNLGNNVYYYFFYLLLTLLSSEFVVFPVPKRSSHAMPATKAKQPVLYRVHVNKPPAFLFFVLRQLVNLQITY